MNHFAHLVLSQPTLESTVGNLLGDFARGLDQNSLPQAVMDGLRNHRAVDRFTDTHPRVQAMKSAFSGERRRFAGIALDIYFDHLLINHWQQFEQRQLESLIGDFYHRMAQGRSMMPGASASPIGLKIRSRIYWRIMHRFAMVFSNSIRSYNSTWRSSPSNRASNRRPCPDS